MKDAKYKTNIYHNHFYKNARKNVKLSENLSIWEWEKRTKEN